MEWNELAGDFENLVVDVARDETSDQLRRFVAAAKLPKDAVLVDLGCGIGSFIKRFKHRFGAIVGVEFAPDIIARAQKACGDDPKIEWMTMDVVKAAKRIGPLADLTVCFNVITSGSAATRSAQFAGVAGVTKPGGMALAVVPSRESEEMVQARSGEDATGFTEDGLAEKGGSWQKHYRRDELVSIFASNGLKVKRIGKVYAPWSREGLSKPRSGGSKGPFDWICLAERPKAG